MASYDQKFELLVKVRSLLATSFLDNTSYIIAGQKPLDEVQSLMGSLGESRSGLAALVYNEAQHRSEEVARKIPIPTGLGHRPCRSRRYCNTAKVCRRRISRMGRKMAT